MRLVKIKKNPSKGLLVELLVDDILSATLYCNNFRFVDNTDEILCYNSEGVYLGSMFYDKVQHLADSE